ncbi:DedA family protein [Paenibacillus chartarius]|uniref:DedA family protein n=1 Tax=Paenibacillus chartarius TaxID=747481 RepID=A0ABV6DLT8_9BACL
MQAWITEIMNQFGYFGIFLLIALENLFPPIPSEVILTFGGFMTTQSDLNIIGVIMFSTIGSVFGAIVLYWVGRLLSVQRLESIVVKYGKILRLTPEDVQKANNWFTKYGVWTVFFGRLIPLIRSLISIPAGSTRMNMATFLIFTTLGSLIWNSVLVYVGVAVGASWETIVHYMDVYSNFVYAGLALIIVVGGFLFFRSRFLQK